MSRRRWRCGPRMMRRSRRMLERYRRQLHVHCYRMLGSVEDADDHVQETFLGAWRARSRFEGRASFRTWLYRIATNACLRTLRRSPRRMTVPEIEEPVTVDSDWTRPTVRAAASTRGRQVARSLSRRAARAGGAAPGRARGARGRARDHRAHLHGGDPAPAAAPARGPDPVLHARVVGKGGRHRAEHDRPSGQQRTAASARHAAGTTSRAAARRGLPSERRPMKNRSSCDGSWPRGSERTPPHWSR